MYRGIAVWQQYHYYGYQCVAQVYTVIPVFGESDSNCHPGISSEIHKI